MNILELGGKVKARDLVKHQDLPEIKGGVLNRELPPHSVLILRMESEKRLEATVYEAEWAYLPCFNDLGKTPKSIVYAPLHEASGGMKVSYLGGRIVISYSPPCSLYTSFHSAKFSFRPPR